MTAAPTRRKTTDHQFTTSPIHAAPRSLRQLRSLGALVSLSVLVSISGCSTSDGANAADGAGNDAGSDAGQAGASLVAGDTDAEFCTAFSTLLSTFETVPRLQLAADPAAVTTAIDGVIAVAPPTAAVLGTAYRDAVTHALAPQASTTFTTETLNAVTNFWTAVDLSCGRAGLAGIGDAQQAVCAMEVSSWTTAFAAAEVLRAGDPTASANDMIEASEDLRFEAAIAADGTEVLVPRFPANPCRA